MSQNRQQSLAVKYRPKTFEDVCEQDSIVQILQYQIDTKTFKNSALFCGPSGTGKTTLGRIFAKEINKGAGTPIEMDAASNNGVDTIRDITARAQQKALDAEYKVFIIDEAHAITNNGWQAFLKVLEDTPPKTIFLFCTTDPQKIPATILSRVQRFDLKRLSFSAIVERLKYILDCENTSTAGLDNENDLIATPESVYTYEVAAIEYIAKIAEGGMRDAITMMDKCLSYSNNLTLQNVITALGAVDYTVYFNLTNAILDYEALEAISITKKVHSEGSDLKQFIKQFTYFLLDVCKYAITKDFEYLQVPVIYEKEMKELIEGVDSSFYKYLLVKINALNSAIKWEQNVKPIIEINLLELCTPAEQAQGE